MQFDLERPTLACYNTGGEKHIFLLVSYIPVPIKGAGRAPASPEFWNPYLYTPKRFDLKR